MKKTKARSSRPGEAMNGLETRYSLYLEDLKKKGEILEWWYEPLTFRLAKRTTYTPDFLIMKKDLTMEVHETKGFWRPAARVKIKVAAKAHRWLAWYGVRWLQKEWKYEEF